MLNQPFLYNLLQLHEESWCLSKLYCVTLTSTVFVYNNQPWYDPSPFPISSVSSILCSRLVLMKDIRDQLFFPSRWPLDIQIPWCFFYLRVKTGLPCTVYRVGPKYQDHTNDYHFIHIILFLKGTGIEKGKSNFQSGQPDTQKPHFSSLKKWFFGHMSFLLTCPVLRFWYGLFFKTAFPPPSCALHFFNLSSNYY